MRRQPHPRIQRHVVFPKYPPFLPKGILHGELHRPNRLVRRRGLVPHNARVLGRVMRGRGAELDADVVFRRRAFEVIKQPV